MKRYDIDFTYDPLRPSNFIDNDDGELCKYSDVEKLVEINREMFELLKKMYEVCNTEWGFDFLEADEMLYMILKAEQLNE